MGADYPCPSKAKLLRLANKGSMSVIAFTIEGTHMNDSTVWWLVTGVLVAAELMTGTFYLLMLAIGALAAALAACGGGSTETPVPPAGAGNPPAPSPAPAPANVNLSYTKRVSPDVAVVVAYDELMFCAVVTTIGSVDVPPIKPFKDDTGPVNVVIAMIFFLHTKLSSLVLYASAGTV